MLKENQMHLRKQTMTRYLKMFAPVGIALLFATASFAQQVKTDYDRGTDFSHYKTYSWEKVQTPDALWVDRIKEAVNSALSAKAGRRWNRAAMSPSSRSK